MRSMAETMRSLIDNMDEANFIAVRNGETLGKVVGINASVKQQIMIIKSFGALAVGDCLTDRSGKRFIVTSVSGGKNVIVSYSQSLEP